MKTTKKLIESETKHNALPRIPPVSIPSPKTPAKKHRSQWMHKPNIHKMHLEKETF